jgi:zinc/manganese transport system substrate-binding protein
MRAFLIAPLAIALAACGGPAAEPVEPAALQVVTTTTVLGSIVDEIVACGGGASSTLTPIGVDPHDFNPSAEQVAQIVRADVVFANGLDYESGLTAAIENAQSDGARVIEIAPKLDPLEFVDDHDEDDDHGHGSLDPHVWLDMQRMARAAEIIGGELDQVTAQNGTYANCGARLATAITTAEADVKATLAQVPEGSRVLVTDHESLGYFAAAYDFEIAGTVIPSNTTLAQPSSAELASLANLMRDENVSVIFVNTAEPTRLAEAVAAETGTDVRIETLYVESLGEPGSGADTYIGMMQTNAERIAKSLAG